MPCLPRCTSPGDAASMMLSQVAAAGASVGGLPEVSAIQYAVAWLYARPQDSGPPGPQGPIGNTGPAGADGPQGPKGDTGNTGPQGNPGNDGAQGPQGTQGVQGNVGNTGPQGIQGVKGDTGDAGPTGSQGVQGNQGIQGVQGIQGTTGPAGPLLDIPVYTRTMTASQTIGPTQRADLYGTLTIPGGVLLTVQGRLTMRSDSVLMLSAA